jgi:hypothetical protein
MWWGRFEIPEGDSAAWRLGPLRLWVTRRARHWRVVWTHARDAMLTDLDLTRLHEEPTYPAEVELARFFAISGEVTLCLSPGLADRAVVARLEAPFHLLPGDDLAFYVSAPLWVQLEVQRPGEERPRFLQEIPSWRPSDTWFGPSPMQGELCYASRTEAKIALEELPAHPLRAITRVHVRNRTQASFLLERLRLPMPSLRLAQDEEGRLWTSSVTVTQVQESGPVALELDAADRREGLTWVAEPRQSSAGLRLGRALKTFWT